MFLETGNSKAGLFHIVESHAADFANVGVSESQIPNLIIDVVTKGKQVGMQGGRPVYEVIFNGEVKKVAVTVSNNGFIVGANPVTKLK